MAKNKVSEWSSNPANNTDVGGIDIAEGCAPSGINNAIREMMAQIKDMESGADGDNLNVGGTLNVTGATSLSSTLAVTGATTLSSTLTVSDDIVGDLVGNVTGNVTGNLISVSNTVNAVDLIAGHTYIIATVGTTNWTSIGASSATVGVKFTKNSTAATGDGTATTVTGNAVNVTGTVAVANGGTGVTSLNANSVLVGGTSISSIKPSTNGNVLTSTAGATVNAGSFVVGTEYTIASVGSTDFTAIGAATNTVGVVFTATGVGTGDGTSTTNTWTSAAASNPAKLSTASGSAPSYSARAFANINGNSVIDLNGQTYSQVGTTVTVTTTSAHPFNVGDAVFLNFTSGSATDALFTIATVADNTHFTVTRGTSISTGGLVNIPLRTIRNGKNVSSVTANTTSSSASIFYVNFTTALPDADSAAISMVNTGTVTVTSTGTTYITINTSANNPSIISVVLFD